MVKPLNDFVALKIIEDQSSSLILGINEEYTLAQVIAVGEGYLTPNAQRVPLTVQEGDYVLLEGRNNLLERKLGSEKVAFVRESQILAIVAKEETNKEETNG